jgi:hypothetical protein
MTPHQRFNLIMARQGHFEWGDTYVPSTLATPKEAPKISRVSRLTSQKLGREIHALSQPEKFFTLLALYQPALIDLHEQKMLWQLGARHPLQGHPLMKGIFLSPPRGTVDIAKELGFKHYEIGVDLPDGRRARLPFPYQGDLLLYLASETGIPYAVNWTVKDVKPAFEERRASKAKTPVQQRKDRDHAQLRALLEQTYYASAGIRTVKVSLDELPISVLSNLELVFPFHQVALTLDRMLLCDFSDAVLEAFWKGMPLFHLVIAYAERWAKGDRDQFIARIYQDIWRRRLPVSFFKPILIDQPMPTDGRDLLKVCEYLFTEKQP